MSQKSGDRSRFNRLRKAKMHDRTRIRALRTALGLNGQPAVQKTEAPPTDNGGPAVSESKGKSRT